MWLGKFVGLRRKQVIAWFQNKGALGHKQAGLELP